MKLLRKLLLIFLAATAAFVLLCLIVPLPPVKPFSRIIEDRHGTLLTASLATDDRWRLKTEPSEIPDKLKRILIRKEDRFFYYHPGVNPFAVGRAAFRNLISGKQTLGASTITMQVARMLEPKPRTIPNKILEMFRAFQLEVRYSKNQILEMYLSMVPYGGNIEGLKSAALIYYQTPIERLNIARLMDLIIIPKNPNALRPDRYADRLLERRKSLVASFRHRGFLTAQDSSIAWSTPAGTTRSRPPFLAPNFCLRLEAEGSDLPSTVHSSLDLRMQQTAEAMLSSTLRPWKQIGVNNGAVLIVKNDTREVLAYVGTENFLDVNASGQVDAVQAIRSPGSTLKPFLVAMAMDDGTITSQSRLLDLPYDIAGYTPENYDRTYSGFVTVEDALKRSLNIPMIHLLKDCGVQRFLDALQQSGFNTIQKHRDKLGLSLITGGCGVTMEELVGSYTSFPNGGLYRPLQFVKVTSGVPEKKADPETGSRRVFSPSAAFMVTDILGTKSRPDLPNNFESSLNLPRVAFKTGTSYGRRDAWAIGYSAEYTIGVWIGNVTSAGNPDLSGTKAAAPLLIDLFTTVSTQFQKAILPQPSDVMVREVCAKSGLLPGHGCTDRTEEYYSLRHTLERVCTVDSEYIVSPDNKITYCMTCVGNSAYKTVSMGVYPPELISFWKANGRIIETPPPHNPQCTRVFAGAGPHIISPQDGMTYFLLSPHDGIGLEAASGTDVRQHVWYIDDRLLSRLGAGTKTRAMVEPGRHTITCMDEKGRLSSVEILIKSFASSSPH